MEKGSDLLRQVIVILSAGVAIVGSFIGSGAAGGTPIKDAAGGALGVDATLIAPGGAAFGIWTVIYIGLVAYAIWQSLPAQREDPRQRLLGYPIAVSLVLNAAWIMSIQFDLLGLSVPVIVLLLADLAWAFLITLASRPKNIVDTIITDGTICLYLGWVAIATDANITAYLVAEGFDGFGLNTDGWAVVVLGVAGVVGVMLAVVSRGRIAPAVALAWGLGWVAVARLTGNLLSTPAAITAIVAALAILAITVSMRMRTKSRRPKTGSSPVSVNA